MVKPKRGFLQIFNELRRGALPWILPGLALLTFISSWAAAYPTAVVERFFARFIFPEISHLAGEFADLVWFSWLDVTIPVVALILIILVTRKKWLWLANLAAGLYLVFFWTWGLNYHRQPLNSKLQLDSTRMEAPAIMEFARRAAVEINRLYGEKPNPIDESGTRAEAARRVRKVIALIDGADWKGAERVKFSWIGGPWLRAAGVDGLFNPLAHEPIISRSLLDVERPFVIAHEYAHVRGYTDEGDANVIAMFATLMSTDPALQYSGWLSLWLYLRTPETANLLDPGPRRDVERIFERARAEQVRWINDFQRALLDWFLKANSVDEGVHSYSRIVLTAAGSEPFWDRFR
jgi:hypothetical protein